MDAHRRMIQRRQAFSGDPFPVDSTGGISTPTPQSDSSSTSGPSPTDTNNQPSPSSTLPGTPPAPSSTSTSSSPSSLSTSTPPSVLPSPSSTATTLVSVPHASLPSTSFSRPRPTSLTSRPSPTSTGASDPNSDATISTGAVVGGIAAGILGLAGIIFAVLYFIRRMKKKKSDHTFDSDVFRRQSRMLHDEPQVVPDSNNDSPFAPRPPTMIERRMNSTPVSNMGGHPYGPGPAYGGYNDYSAGYDQPGFSPGQVFPHHQSYGDSYMDSPMSAPMSPPMSVSHGDVGAEQSRSAYLSRQPPTNDPALTDNNGHYVDLSRSSVTPFQAAQYEEIHRRLNMPPAAPVLGSLAEDEYPQKELAPQGPSPFADPSEVMLPPPSPAHSNRDRIDSNPPKLPELNPPMSPVYALHPTPAEVLRKKSEVSTAGLPAAPAPAYVARPNLNQKRPDTVYTIYDDEDAYAGI